MTALAASDLRKVHLYGHLRKHCGRSVVTLAVRSLDEAVRALNANFPGFAAAMREGRYRLVVGKLDRGTVLTEEAVKNHSPLAEGSIHIVPQAVGAKNFLQAVLGAIILTAAFVFAPPAGFLTSGSSILGANMGASALFGLTTFGNLALIGGGLLLAGLFTPKADFNNKEKADSRSTFFSNGAVNQVEEGATLPLIYGEVVAGSVVINAGLAAEDVRVTS